MSNLRAVATLILIAGIALLAIFQMQIRGYTKVARINEWVLYQDEDMECEVLEIEGYYLECGNSYIIKTGFEEKSLIDGVTDENITIIQLIEHIDEVVTD